MHSSCQTLTGASWRLEAYCSARAGLQTGGELGREGGRGEEGGMEEGGRDGGGRKEKVGRAAL